MVCGYRLCRYQVPASYKERTRFASMIHEETTAAAVSLDYVSDINRKGSSVTSGGGTTD